MDCNEVLEKKLEFWAGLAIPSVLHTMGIKVLSEMGTEFFSELQGEYLFKTKFARDCFLARMRKAIFNEFELDEEGKRL